MGIDGTYDSRPDTYEHIAQVQRLLQAVVVELGNRMREHDQSKLVSPEVEVFDRVTPLLEKMTYGSDEYKAALESMGDALAHHYAFNRHHPEHFDNGGVTAMNLVDVMEMLCDWKAATLRHADGDLERSIAHNAGRFSIDPQLLTILHNTARDFGWL